MKHTELTPFIKLFRINNTAYYCFDVNTNHIVELTPSLYKILLCLSKNNYSDIEMSADDIKNMKYLYRCGLFQEYPQVNVKHPLSDTLEDILSTQLSNLCLQVTQRCNLRCSYCIYSGNYTNRSHSNKNMRWDIAKKAIDYYHQHSYASKDIIVGFYGGEPLLEFELIKRCVEYSKSLFLGKNLKFIITTNGTLLTEEISDFLFKENFNITLSIDGPKDIQNLNRVYADGKGSFDDVMKNLEYIIRKYPQSISQISINSVVSGDADYDLMSDFFSNDARVKMILKRLTMQRTSEYKGCDEKIIQSDKNTSSVMYDRFKALMFLKNRLNLEDINDSALDYIVSIHDLIHKRTILNKPVRKDTHPGGPCVPGKHRLFVDVEGVFRPCERVNETSAIMTIGDVSNGIDYDAAKKILNVGQVSSAECLQCWAFNFCTLCVAQCDGGNQISKKKRLSNCKQVHANVLDMLKCYTIINKYRCQIERAKGVTFSYE